MRIILAECSVIYSGRGDTKLPPAQRLIVIKSDGAVAVHHDAGTKPLNYMGKGNVLTIEESDEETGELETWSFDTRKESLQITMHNKFTEISMPLDVDNSVLERDGTESHLQEWIQENPHVLGEGWKVIDREFQTGAGPVDLLAENPEGHPVAVEVKRTAMIGAVDQAQRYVTALKELDPKFEKVTGLVAALDVRPKTRELADKRKIPYLELPMDKWKQRKETLSED